MIGIYKITNQVNGKVYIGQSRNIEKRWNQHRTTAFNSNNHNYNLPLYRAIRKYGIENFIFEVLEECKIEELNEKEKYYIKLYNSYFEGYNLTLGGDASGSEINKEKVIGIIHDLETTEMFHSEIAKKWGFSDEMVQGINSGRYWRQDREYPIQKISLERGRRKYYCAKCGMPVSKKAKLCRKCYNFSKRKTERPSREELKQLIRTKPFTQIGEIYDVSDSTICKWCKCYNLPFRKRDINLYTDEKWALI